jgi:hypothetical protein
VDPDFDPKQRAFYYVRVIEVPKPRWTAYDANFFGVDMPYEIRMTTGSISKRCGRCRIAR